MLHEQQQLCVGFFFMLMQVCLHRKCSSVCRQGRSSETGALRTPAATPEGNFWMDLGNASSRVPGLGVSVFSNQLDHPTAFDNEIGAGLTYSPFDLGAALDYPPLPVESFGFGTLNGNAPLLNQPSMINSPSLPAVSHDRITKQRSSRYVCLEANCDRTFSRPSDLARHLKSRHCPPTFNCPVDDCDRKGSRGFPRKDKLGDHLRQKHRRQM